MDLVAKETCGVTVFWWARGPHKVLVLQDGWYCMQREWCGCCMPLIPAWSCFPQKAAEQ
jgi:hypothetical protein